MATYYEEQMSKLTTEEKRALWREKSKAYRDKHPEKYKASRKENDKKHADKNRESNNQKSKDRYYQHKEANPDGFNMNYEANQKYRRENWSSWILSLIKRRCKQKDLPFNLEPSDIPLPEYCPVLGIKLNPG